MKIIFQEMKSFEVDGKRYYSTPEGKFPSVTTILQSLDNEHIEKWKSVVGEEEAKRVVSEAVNRGTLIHRVIETYLKKESIDHYLKNPLVKCHFNQIKFALDKFDPVIAQEIPVYSKRWKMAGRCDCVAYINGELYVIDFKTSRLRKERDQIKGYELQATAYGLMLNEMFETNIEKYIILVTNLDEMYPSIFKGQIKHHMRDLAEVRRKFKNAA